MEKLATFAGGCFWCMEPEFYGVAGVIKVLSGYIGGTTKNPTYEQVCAGGTGHIEAIQVAYDASQISYQQLLDIFWRNIDPMDEYGQFADKGSQYRAGIFTHDDEQKKLAEASKQKLGALFSKPIATFIREATLFWAAEDYHQEFFIKSRMRYKSYSTNNGRKERLEEVWRGKLSNVS